MCLTKEMTLESAAEKFCDELELELDEQHQQIELSTFSSIEQIGDVSARFTQTSPLRNDLSQPTTVTFTAP